MTNLKYERNEEIGHYGQTLNNGNGKGYEAGLGEGKRLISVGL